MNGSFTLGLLELFAYLIPGVIITVPIVLLYGPWATPELSKETLIWIALALSYVVGQAIVIFSWPLMKIKDYIEAKKGQKCKLSFFSELKQLLKKRYFFKESESDEDAEVYFYSVKLVAFGYQRIFNMVERQFAMSMFARNTCIACVFLTLITFINEYFIISSFAFITSVLLFARYTQFEISLRGTVLRTAYMHLKDQELSTASDETN